MPVARTLCAVVFVLTAGACGASFEPCRGEASCPAGTVCEASGECRPLALDPVIRTARATWLLPNVARAFPTSADAGDAIRLGGDSRAALFLSFGPLPDDARDATAALLLTPHASFTRPTGPLTLVVDRVRPLSSDTLPEPITRRAGTRALGPDSRGVIRIDLSALVREASRAGVRTLDLALRAEGDAAFRLASPASLDRDARPRLEVLVP